MPRWSLLARIGDGPVFEIGKQSLLTKTNSGQLYLSVNAAPGTSLSGNWTVAIKLGTLPPPPGSVLASS
jgi:hypothetical protein